MVVISNPSSCRCSSLVGERKPHDEAGAAQPVVSRFDRDPALMPLDDRACNGEAESRMRPECLALGANRLESAEDRVARFVWNAGAFVLDANHEGAVFAHDRAQIGRESCRESVVQYV